MDKDISKESKRINASEQEKTKIPLVQIDNMTWWYQDSKKILFKKFNFSLTKGDFVVVTGKSGTWKSTLVKFLIGQIKPEKRTIYYKMEDMAEFGDDEIQRYRRKIGIIFQDYQLINSLTAKQNVIYPLVLDQIPLTEIKKKYEAINALLDISSIETTEIKKLSWGEKQKIAMARALIHAPDFIIADEPTWNLDYESTLQIADILIKANEIWNTIVLVTHDTVLLEYLKKHIDIKTISLWH